MRGWRPRAKVGGFAEVQREDDGGGAISRVFPPNAVSDGPSDQPLHTALTGLPAGERTALETAVAAGVRADVVARAAQRLRDGGE